MTKAQAEAKVKQVESELKKLWANKQITPAGYTEAYDSLNDALFILDQNGDIDEAVECSAAWYLSDNFAAAGSGFSNFQQNFSTAFSIPSAVQLHSC